jgi:hypothetical protein
MFFDLSLYESKDDAFPLFIPCVIAFLIGIGMSFCCLSCLN